MYVLIPQFPIAAYAHALLTLGVLPPFRINNSHQGRSESHARSFRHDRKYRARQQRHAQLLDPHYRRRSSQRAALDLRPPSARHRGLQRRRRRPLRARHLRHSRDPKPSHADAIRRVPRLQLRAPRHTRQRDILRVQSVQRLCSCRHDRSAHRRVVPLPLVPRAATSGEERDPGLELPLLARADVRMVRRHQGGVYPVPGRHAHERDPVRLQLHEQHAAAGWKLHFHGGRADAIP